MSMITPITVEGFPRYARPWNNITPFTYRDGLTYQEVLEDMRHWIRNTLVPHIDSEMAEIGDAWNSEVLALVEAVNAVLASGTDKYEEAVDAALEAVNALVDAANVVVDQKIDSTNRDLDAKVTAAVNTFNQATANLNAIADKWRENTVENNDDITADIFNDPSSMTRTALSNIIAGVLSGQVVAGGNVDVTVGPGWDIDVEVIDGIANFSFTVPPGGTAWVQGIPTSGTNFDEVRTPGMYIIPSSAAAANYSGLPVSNRAQIITVGKSEGASATTQESVVYYSTTAPVRRFSRASITASGGWSPWDSGGWVKGVLSATPEAPINVDTHRVTGSHFIPNRGNFIGLPGTGIGRLTNYVDSATGLSEQRFTEYKAIGGEIVEWARTTGLVSGWAGVDWRPVGGGAGKTNIEVADVQVSDHATRVEISRARRAGCEPHQNWCR